MVAELDVTNCGSGIPDLGQYAAVWISEKTSAGVAAIVVDAELRVFDANQQFGDLLRRPRSELVGADFFGLMHGDDVPFGRARVRRTRDGSLDRYQAVRRFHRGDERVSRVLVSTQVVRTADGQPAFALLTAHDLTPDVPLHHFMDAFRPLFDVSDDLVVVFDKSGRVFTVAGRGVRNEGSVGELFEPDTANELVGALESAELTPEPRVLAGSLADGSRGRIRYMRSPVAPDLAVATFTVPREEVGAELQARIRSLQSTLSRVGELVLAAEELDLGPAPMRPIADLIRPLNERERSVVLALAKGKRTKRIAEELYVSQSAVRNYLSSIYGKLGVRTQAELLELIADAR